ncbi:MAG: hypothetical protein ACFFB3_23660 [Candidatus Hodarchaeota archaeon]
MLALRRQQIFSFFWLAFMLSLLNNLVPSPAGASDLTDSHSDVKFENTQARGLYMESIDITKVTTEGSWIRITCQDPLSLEIPDIIQRYVVLFSEDTNPTDWEAAIKFTSYGSNIVETSWKIGRVTLDEAITESNWWYVSSDQTYYSLLGERLLLNFAEYHATDYAELAVWTEGITVSLEGERNIYHDWAPDSLEEWTFEASEEVIIQEPASRKTETKIRSTESTAAIPGFGISLAAMTISLICMARRGKNGV